MKRILIVDDAIEVCRLFQDALRTAYPDIPVTIVPSGEEALLESTRLSFDLLVTDIRLPGMSGLELVRKIRVRQPRIRVILITGLTLDDHLEKQKDELQPDLFFQKPVGAAVFLDAVERFVGQAAPAAGSAISQPVKAESSPIQTNSPAPSDALLEEFASVLPGEPADRSSASPQTEIHNLHSSPAEPEQSEAVAGLSEVLTRLRSSLGGTSAILLDERGHVVAQAGDLPDLSSENHLLSALMAAVSAGAKVSYALDQSALEMVHAYRGVSEDLLASPVGQYVLVLAIKRGRSALRLALAFEEILSARIEVLAALQDMGLYVQSAAEVGASEIPLSREPVQEEVSLETAEPQAEPDPSLEKLEALFSSSATAQLNLQDADAFWEQASGPESSDVTDPAVLSFDQALKLGLLPQDDEEEKG